MRWTPQVMASSYSGGLARRPYIAAVLSRPPASRRLYAKTPGSTVPPRPGNMGLPVGSRVALLPLPTTPLSSAMDATSASLLERLNKSSDEEAWSRFVKLYTPLLYHWARRFGLDSNDASDL